MPFTISLPGRARRAGAPRAAGAAIGALALLLLAGCGSGQEGATVEAGGAGSSTLTDDAAKASYSLGYRFAENVQRQFPDDIEQEAFVSGVRDQLAGENAKVGNDEAERVLTAMMEAREAKAATRALENLEEGLAFLEENAKREQVTALDSGLQYEVLEQGEGTKPTRDDTVTTHYEGRLIDGTVFDSSYERGEPASFPLDRVIPGWTEGLQLMSPGAKYRLFVPSDLAYGDRAAGSIPPNSTLIFDVELLNVGAPGEGAPGEGAPGEGEPGEGEEAQ